MLSIDGGVSNGAHVRGYKAGVIPQLPSDHVPDLGAGRIPRAHGDLVKVDVLRVVAVYVVDARVRDVGAGRARSGFQTASGEAVDEPGGQEALGVQDARLETDVGWADETAGADQGCGAEEIGVVSGEGGGESAAEGVAHDVEGG